MSLSKSFDLQVARLQRFFGIVWVSTNISDEGCAKIWVGRKIGELGVVVEVDILRWRMDFWAERRVNFYVDSV